MDILLEYKEKINFKILRNERKNFKNKLLSVPFYKDFNKYLGKISRQDFSANLLNDKITINSEKSITKVQYKNLKDVISILAPWRIGPYNILGYDIESEWNSFLKFNRLKELIPNLKDKIIADIGGNNGYFSFRLSTLKPKLIINSDPMPKNYFQFKFLQKFLNIKNILHEPIKAENFSIFNNFFDVIFCLGVIYHQRNPLLMLNEVWKSLNKNGILILETIVYDNKKPIALCPKTYSKMRNVWFLPTPSCLKRWLEINNFEILDESELCVTTKEEQRRTKDATFESLEDFLDPNDNNLTIEGYHAPKRYIVIAKKKLN